MQHISPQQSRHLHALLNQLEILHRKKDIIDITTYGRTTSSRELSYFEANQIIANLESEVKQTIQPLRNKIIHYCAGYMDMETPQRRPDYERINGWIQNIGSRNPKKKKLHQLKKTELHKILNQIEHIVRKKIHS